MDSITFSYNWNNKLDCKSFTTIRLDNSNKYILLTDYEIILTEKKQPITKGIATIIEIKRFRLEQLSEFMARIDTGYSLEETLNIIYRMYPRINKATQIFNYILLSYKKPENNAANC